MGLGRGDGHLSGVERARCDAVSFRGRRKYLSCELKFDARSREAVLRALDHRFVAARRSRTPAMTHLYQETSVRSLYTDRKFGAKEEWESAIQNSTTLYIGNLSFYTTEEQLYEFFGRAGEVKRIIMGLDRHAKTPCGFCFVEYCWRRDTEDAMRFLNGLKLDERIVRCDWDGGFVEGRQYGRGRSGGQVRDEYRADYDESAAAGARPGRAAARRLPAPAGRASWATAGARTTADRGARRRMRARARRPGAAAAAAARRRRRRARRRRRRRERRRSVRAPRSPSRKTRASARSATTTTTIRLELSNGTKMSRSRIGRAAR